MLHRSTGIDEQLQTFKRRQFVPVAEIGDAEVCDQFHDEVRPDHSEHKSQRKM